jgi:acyl-coenzyme A thioesterase 13
MEIPEDFEAVQTGSPFVDLAGPFFFKEVGDVVTIGLRIDEKHCNSAGTAHGGLISTMSDIALGNSIGHASISEEERRQWREDEFQLGHPPIPRVTVNLTTDYAGFARVGDWVEMHVDIQKLGKSLAFASAYLYCDGERIARSNGVYRNLG